MQASKPLKDCLFNTAHDLVNIHSQLCVDTSADNVMPLYNQKLHVHGLMWRQSCPSLALAMVLTLSGWPQSTRHANCDVSRACWGRPGGRGDLTSCFMGPRVWWVLLGVCVGASEHWNEATFQSAVNAVNACRRHRRAAERCEPSFD